MINTQNRTKVLAAIIVILMIANIILVSLFLLNKDGRKREGRMDRKAMIERFLKDEIGFSPAQLQQYDTLSNAHRENMKNMFDSLKNSKDKQFRELASVNFSDSAMNMAAEQSAVSQKVMTINMYNHVKKIRELCTPEQQPKFDSLFGKMLNRRSGDGKMKFR